MSLTPAKKLAIFQNTFVDYFLNELSYLAAVANDQASPRDDFIDQICKVISFGLVVGGVGVDALVPGVGTIGTEVINQGMDIINDARKAERSERIGRIYDVLTMESKNWTKQQDELRILVENVAAETAYRHQHTIINVLNDDPLEGIIPFAKVAVQRTFEFIARKDLELTEEYLLQGLIEGRSGGGVDKFLNNKLGTKERRKKESDVTAEGVLGRSPFRSHKGNYYILHENGAVHKKTFKELKLTPQQIQNTMQKAREEKDKDLTSPSKWVKFKAHLRSAHVDAFLSLSGTQLSQLLESTYDCGYADFTHDEHGKEVPKYPFVNMPSQEIKRYGYYEQKLTKEEKKELDKKFRPTIKITTKKHVEEYLAKIKKANTGQSPITFNTYIAKIYKGAEIAACHDDLSSLDLSGGDFSGSDFRRCIIGKKLIGTKFNGTNLRDATIETGANAEATEFNEAKLEYLKAEEVNFTNAQFNQASLNYAKLSGADLTGMKALGANWLGADITHVTSENLKEITDQQNQKLAELEKALKRKFAKLSARIEKQAKEVDAVKQELQKLEQTSTEQAGQLQTILDNLLEEHNLHEAFEVYCRSELVALQATVTALQADSQVESINELGLQLKNLQKNQRNLPKLLKDISQLAGRLQKQEEKTEGIAKQIEFIKKNSELYISQQSIQFTTLQGDLANVQITILEIIQKQAVLEERVTKIEEGEGEQEYELAKDLEMRDRAKANVINEETGKKISGKQEDVSNLMSKGIHTDWMTLLGTPTKKTETSTAPLNRPLAKKIVMTDDSKITKKNLRFDFNIELTASDEEENSDEETKTSSQMKGPGGKRST